MSLTTIAASARADGNWVDYRETGSFMIRTEFRLPSQPRLLNELRQLELDVAKTLGLKLTDRSIQINFLSNKRSYVQYMSKRYSIGARRRALFVQDSKVGQVYLFRHLQYATDLRHEGTHALIHSSLVFMPLWLDEGLAEYFEVPREKRTAGHLHLKALRWTMRFGWKPSMSALEQLEDLSQMKTSHYREAWAWAHFMLHGPKEIRDEFASYLKDIKSGKAPGLLSERMAKQVPHFEAMLLDHLRNWRR